MVVIAREENGESVDWMEEEDLNMDGIQVPQEKVDVGLPILPLSEHFKSAWEEELISDK